MKTLSLLLAVMFVCIGIVSAEDMDTSTVPVFGIWGSHSHKVYIDEGRDPEFGAGLDLVVFQNEDCFLEEITVEGRHDFNNSNSSVYGVARVNGFKAVKNLFSSIF